jgi:hypothetical protein
MKKYYIFIFTLTIFLNFTACSSAKKTFGSSQNNKSYAETLTAFYSQLKKNNLILIGKKHNYVFNNSEKLIQVLKKQKLLQLNPSNMRLNIRVKEYKSSVVTLTFFSHFEKSKLNQKQITWLASHDFSLEQRATYGGKKSETSRPKEVDTFVLFLKLQGERQKRQDYKEKELLTPAISLEVAEHITL